MIAGIASIMNIHCQPASPQIPCISSNAAEIGEPTAVAIERLPWIKQSPQRDGEQETSKLSTK